MNHKRFCIAVALLSAVLISCNGRNPITPSNRSLNQSNLIGKWLSPSVWTLDSSGYYTANFDTLEFKSSSYIRTNFINVYPGFGWEIGTYNVKLDTIIFSGKDYSIDSLHNIIDSQQIYYYWKCNFENDSTLRIVGSIYNDEIQYFYITKTN
jgi:hypothetical protein